MFIYMGLILAAFFQTEKATNTPNPNIYCQAHDLIELHVNLEKELVRNPVVFVGQVNIEDYGSDVLGAPYYKVGLANIKIVDVLKGEISTDYVNYTGYQIDKISWNRMKRDFLLTQRYSDQLFDTEVRFNIFEPFSYNGSCSHLPLLAPGEYYVFLPKQPYSYASIIFLNGPDDPIIEKIEQLLSN